MYVGIHESVEAVFPPERLGDLLSDADCELAVVDEPVGCDAVVTFAYDESFLEHVDWIHSIQAGVDRFPFDRLRDAGVTLTNSTGIHGESVGETVTGYMLTFARRLHRYRDAQRRGEWAKPAWNEPFTLAGEQVCVVGLGTLGRGVARRADALGMDVVGVRRSPLPVEHVRETYTTDRLHEAIDGARFVVVTVPLTEATRGLVGEAELATMREDAYLVNVARGPVVDESALVEGLESGRIAGAALDTFETEPLPDDSPLWGMDEVLVTPHVAAFTAEYVERIADIVQENVRRQRVGEGYANEVL
jgi:D-2-hydroxyacid dehydrogenase (NADP+)